MNKRALRILAAIQLLFAMSLIYVGIVSRNNRQLDYLERTQRIIAGRASSEDFENVKRVLPKDSDADAVRSLLGLPVLRARQLVFVEPNIGEQNGTFWIYYPREVAPAPVDADSVALLKGPIRCFVVKMQKDGAFGEMATVNHPLAPAVR